MKAVPVALAEADRRLVCKAVCRRRHLLQRLEAERRAKQDKRLAGDREKQLQEALKQDPSFRQRQKLLEAERKMKERQREYERKKELANAPRYPIEDLQVPAAHTVVHAVPSGEMKLVPHQHVGDLLMAWDFLQRFWETLLIDNFGLDDFVQGEHSQHAACVVCVTEIVLVQVSLSMNLLC